MSRKITSEEWRAMEQEDRSRTLDQLVTAARGVPNGELAAVTEEITAFEHRFDLPTDRMLQRLQDGSLTETSEITDWLMLERRRERMAKHEAKSP